MMVVGAVIAVTTAINIGGKGGGEKLVYFVGKLTSAHHPEGSPLMRGDSLMAGGSRGGCPPPT